MAGGPRLGTVRRGRRSLVRLDERDVQPTERDLGAGGEPAAGVADRGAVDSRSVGRAEVSNQVAAALGRNGRVAPRDAPVGELKIGSRVSPDLDGPGFREVETPPVDLEPRPAAMACGGLPLRGDLS